MVFVFNFLLYLCCVSLPPLLHLLTLLLPLPTSVATRRTVIAAADDDDDDIAVVDDDDDVFVAAL